MSPKPRQHTGHPMNEAPWVSRPSSKLGKGVMFKDPLNSDSIREQLSTQAQTTAANTGTSPSRLR